MHLDWGLQQLGLKIVRQKRVGRTRDAAVRGRVDGWRGVRGPRLHARRYGVDGPGWTDRGGRTGSNWSTGPSMLSHAGQA